MKKTLIYNTDLIEQVDIWLDSVGSIILGKNLSSYGELLGCIEDCTHMDNLQKLHELIQKYDILEPLTLRDKETGEVTRVPFYKLYKEATNK